MSQREAATPYLIFSVYLTDFESHILPESYTFCYVYLTEVKTWLQYLKQGYISSIRISEKFLI